MSEASAALPRPDHSLSDRIRRTTGITTGGFLLLAALAVGWLAARVLGGRGLYLLVYSGVLLIIVSILLARHRRPVQAARSDISPRVREGQVLEIELTLATRRRFGGFTIEERLPALVGPTVRVGVDSIAPEKDWNYRYTVRPRLRGVYEIGPLVAVWNDPFGLAQSEQVLINPAEILVHPSTEPVFDRPLTRQLEDPPIRPPKMKPWPTGFEFYGVRDYVPGDDLRRIVWRAVARTGRMLVRESEQGITDQVNVLLDNDADWHATDVPSETFEAGVRVAASVGTLHLKHGFSVSLHVNDDTVAENLRGPRARISFLDGLARAQLGRQPLHGAVERLLQRRGRNAHNVIITPHFSQETAARAALLIQAGASVLLAAIVSDESDPMSVTRASEIGAEVVQLQVGDPLGAVFAHALGAGTR